jgi:hypothetical protein
VEDLQAAGALAASGTVGGDAVPGWLGVIGVVIGPCSSCPRWSSSTLRAFRWKLLGRQQETESLFERLLGLRNDLGLISEEYDVARKRLVGNFAQAFTHVGIVNTAYDLSRRIGPAAHRGSPD